MPEVTTKRLFVRAYLDFAFKRRKAVVACSLLLGAAAFFVSLKIRLDPDLESLLPRKTETFRALRETNKRFGSADLFTIAIVMDDADSVARIQDEIDSTLKKDWPDLVYSQVARDNAFFEQHALLYLPSAYLKDILGKLKQVELDLGNRTPLGVDLLSDDSLPARKAPPLQWFKADLPQQLGLPDEAADAFTAFFQAGKNGPAPPGEFDPKQGIPARLRARLMGKTREGKTVGLVQAVLKYPSSDIDYVKTVLARSKALLGPSQSRYGSALSIGVEGPYRELEEVNSLSRNGMIATVISIALNILILFAYFRSAAPVLLLGWQAAFTCILTLALTALTYGRLNLYTVFVISILFGMGIDYFTYVLGYAQRQVSAGRSWIEALEEALDALFFSLIVSAATTIAGLLTLLVSKFVGFYEFGILASIGVALSLISTFLIMPSFIFTWESMHAKLPRIWPSLVSRHAPLRMPVWLKKQGSRKIVPFSAAVIGAGTLILACFVPRVRFEYDFDKLRDTHQKSERHLPVSVALNSHRTSSQPVVVLARDSAAMAALHDTLFQRLTVEKDPLLRSFLTLTTFVPPADSQRMRMEYIHAIAASAGKRIFDHAGGDDSAVIAKLRKLGQTAAFSSADIPAWAANLLRERDGSFGKIGFIYGNYNSSNAIEAGKFQDRYGHFDVNGEHLSAYSSSFVFSDITRIVKADSRKLFACLAVILLLLLGLILRSRKLLLICGIEMAVGVIWTLGLMGLFHVKVGVFNLIVITTLQDYSVDVCTYLLLGYLRLGRHRLWELYSGIGLLVAVCTLSTAAGFVGMLFTSHLGIASIGKFAVIGLPAILVTSLGLTPWLAMKFIRDDEVLAGGAP